MRAFRQALSIKLGCALFLLLLFSLLVFDLVCDQAHREQDAEQRVASASQRLANQLTDTLRETDLVFNALNDNPLVRDSLAGRPLQAGERLQLQHLLNASLAHIAPLSQLMLITSDCHILQRSQDDNRAPSLPPQVCDWLQTEGRYSTFAVTSTNPNRNRAEILHAARLYDSNHTRVGMVLASINQDSLQSLLADQAGDSQGEAMILDRHRRIVAFWPQGSASPPATLAEDRARTVRRQEDKQQIDQSLSPRDHQARLYSERTLDNYPLTVRVGHSLAQDRRDLAWQAGSDAVAWLLLALLVLWMGRRQREHLQVLARLRETTEALYASKNTFRSMLEAMPEGILLVDIDSEQCQLANRSARRMLELDNRDGAWNTLDADSSAPRLQVKPLDSWVRQGRQMEGQEVEIERETKTTLWVRVSMHHLRLAGRAVCLITLNDRSDYRSMQHSLEENQRQIESMQRTDPLTQLANRSAVEQALSQEINRCQRYGLPLSLACFDIDAFSAFNARHGRQAGDNVLIAVANQLRDATRSTDVCARVAGQEFMVIFTNTPQIHAYRVMERIRKKIAATIFPFAENNVTFSGGMTSWRPGDSAEAVALRAEALMSQAKLDGHNRLCGDEES